MKYKVGDRVKVIEEDNDWNRNGKVGVIKEIKEINSQPYKVEFDSLDRSGDNYCYFAKSEMELYAPTLEDMPEGTVLEGDYTKKVIHVLKPGLYVLEDITEDDSSSDRVIIRTAKHIKECGYKIKDQDVEEVTMKQVCEKFGKDVKIKKGDK